MFSIKHLFHISTPIDKVYNALATIEGLKNWWTAETTGGDKVSDTIQFRFSGHGSVGVEITALQPGKKVSWKCVESQHGWVDTTFTFSLDENEGKTRVRFSHDGWKEQDDYYAICNFSWGRYMESLRQYCQTGKGEAFGSEGYRQ
jgi:uncharacterized protein YndB with AHSA1/START domain